MDAETPIPRLRADLDLVPFEHEGKSLVLVRDGLGLVPEGRAFALDLLRIIHSLPEPATARDLQAALTRATGGSFVSLDEVALLVAELEANRLLDSEAVAEAKERVVSEYLALACRPPALAGRSYPAGAEECAAWADAVLEYTAISDSVNTAKRIQENSGKNQILISREAYERVKDDIEVEQHAPMTVKGKNQPVEVYEVLGLKKVGRHNSP